MLKNNFCPSPWFHMRITNDGNMNYCRWSGPTVENSNIQEIGPADFFQNSMQPLRNALVEGKTLSGCNKCHHMEQHGKVSGREKQLLKIGVRLDRFEKSLASSPWVDTIAESNCQQLPQDWQIDLGNYCNSACVFCDPKSSSRLATEWKKLGFIDKLPAASWSDDPILLNKFVDTLKQSPHIQYLHFIGGETLITPAFKTILKKLVELDLNRTATIGFTTNLMAWDDSIIELLTQFNGVNLGMSIESFDPINEYVRWPASMAQVHTNLNQWISLAQQHQWLMQFRTTPSVLSVAKLLSVYDYAWDHNIAVESCNFLNRPECMKPSVLPRELRTNIVQKMQRWVDARKINHETIVNTRDPNVAQQQMVQDLESYIRYLNDEPDESNNARELVLFLKRLEANRGNTILQYLPEYEEFFRSAGY